MIAAIALSLIALISATQKPRIAFALFSTLTLLYAFNRRDYFLPSLISALFASLACLFLSQDVAYLPAFLLVVYEIRAAMKDSAFNNPLWSVGLYTSASFFYITFFLFVKGYFESVQYYVAYHFFVALAIGLSASLVESVESDADKRIAMMIASATVFTIFKLYIPEASLQSLAIAFFVSFVLAMMAMKTGVADESGLMSATLIGTTMILFTNIWFFAILLIFYGVGSAVTKFKLSLKQSLGIAEPSGGARGYSNVFGNSLAALFFAMQYGITKNVVFAACFTASVAAALGDTAASEVGKTSEKVYLITNFRRVKPGVSGGVSFIGEIAAFLGVIAVAIPSLLLGIIPASHFIPTVIAAFAAIHIDSVLGATLEEKGYLTNSGVNFLATLSAGIICYLLLS